MTNSVPYILPPGSLTLGDAGLPVCLGRNVLDRDIMPFAQPTDTLLNGAVEIQRDGLGWAERSNPVVVEGLLDVLVGET